MKIFNEFLRKLSFILSVIIDFEMIIIAAKKCTRYPLNIPTSKSPVDDSFVISIAGNPQTYILGQVYNVTLHAYNGYRFINAKLALESENEEPNAYKDLGRFIVMDDVATQYSPNCVNMIETTNSNSKNRMDVQWVAPIEANSGCILIRATVLQYRDIWHMDDGGLTKKICEEIVDDIESHKKSEKEELCCACDEARYEITFESLWSRNLHPKDFPSRLWTTRFSYIMGVSHSSDYRFWDIGELATAAMQEFAEHGSTQNLENDFNDSYKKGKIRTILKAKGPGFPNLNGYSLASIRADPTHHQLSLAAKLEPSPDWFVGVTGLELCQINCTWLSAKNINLYPWDAGTDAGTSYTSSDQPQMPPDVIRRIQLNDPRSPFYDASGVPMKPLAVLKLRRQRIYERKCLDNDFNHDDSIPRECYTHSWSLWSKCSVECGDGIQYRYRAYKQPEVAKIYNCDELVRTEEERPCYGSNCESDLNTYSLTKSINKPSIYKYFNNYHNDNNDNNDNNVNNNNYNDDNANVSISLADRLRIKRNCDVGPWSLWSSCNNTCGIGQIFRQRQYLDTQNEKKCQEMHFIKLYEFKQCIGHKCTDDVYNQSRSASVTNLMDNNYKKHMDNGEHTVFSKYLNTHSPTQYEQRYNNINNNDYNVNDYNLNNYETFEATNLQQKHQQLYHISNEEIDDFNDLDTDDQLYTNSKSSNNRDILRGVFLNTNDKWTDNNIFDYCYKPLQIVRCADPRVIGNYWFYNICTNECMLYAADICDRNLNRFNSMEKCQELCQYPIQRLGRAWLRQKQKHSRQCQKPIKQKY